MRSGYRTHFSRGIDSHPQLIPVNLYTVIILLHRIRIGIGIRLHGRKPILLLRMIKPQRILHLTQRIQCIVFIGNDVLLLAAAVRGRRIVNGSVLLRLPLCPSDGVQFLLQSSLFRCLCGSHSGSRNRFPKQRIGADPIGCKRCHQGKQQQPGQEPHPAAWLFVQLPYSHTRFWGRILPLHL